MTSHDNYFPCPDCAGKGLIEKDVKGVLFACPGCSATGIKSFPVWASEGK